MKVDVKVGIDILVMAGGWSKIRQGFARGFSAQDEIQFGSLFILDIPFKCDIVSADPCHCARKLDDLYKA